MGIACGSKDDAGGGEKQHHHDQDGNHCPGQLNLIAAVNLRRLAICIARALPETDKRIEKHSSDDEEDGQSDREHQHGEIEDGMRGRSGRGEMLVGD